MHVFSTELNLPMEEAITRLAGALAEEGLRIVSDINIQSFVTAALHERFRPYRILGVCAPGLAKSLIGVEAAIGVLLPCNIVLQEYEGRIRVDFADPAAVLGLANRSAVDDLARQVRGILERVCARFRS